LTEEIDIQMNENKSETDLKKFNDVLSYLTSLVFDPTIPKMPDSVADIQRAKRLADTLIEIREALIKSKKGDFSYLVTSKGFMAGALKALQSNLNHIAWLARQVADGDLEQRMDFMGEFSSAFNSMTEQLAFVQNRLKEDKNRLKEDNVKFIHRAFHDQLTGLKNRAYFDEQIINEIARAKRSNSLLAVVMVDVDKFKNVNDTMGHQAGDTLLIEIASRLLKGTRKIDTLARIGGDEFGMLWPNYASNKQHFIKIKDRLISQINSYFELEGSEYKISVSIGISIFPYDGDDPQTLLRVADSSMYQAKGINETSCVFASIDKLDINP
jgi:diguanylate cyclase (GGDEF)-like protein